MNTTHTGRVWKFGDSISTDLLVPGAYVLAKSGIDPAQAAQHCMRSNRPDWAAQVEAGDILVAGRNFGCGSSRNGSAPLLELGISVVLAESVARIHMRNAINTGLPTLVCQGISDAVEEGQELRVDLVTGTVTNLATGAELSADRWPEDSPPYAILMAGGFMPYFRRRLEEAGLL